MTTEPADGGGGGGDPWACNGGGRSPPAVSFPALAPAAEDGDEWLCRECRAGRGGV